MNEDPLNLKLKRLLVLLRDYQEPHWYAYFSEAADLLAAGRIEPAKRKIRGAYGGMCSFSDALYFTGAPPETAKEGYQLRDEVYALSQPSGFFGSLRRFGF